MTECMKSMDFAATHAQLVVLRVGSSSAKEWLHLLTLPTWTGCTCSSYPLWMLRVTPAWQPLCHDRGINFLHTVPAGTLECAPGLRGNAQTCELHMLSPSWLNALLLAFFRKNEDCHWLMSLLLLCTAANVLFWCLEECAAECRFGLSVALPVFGSVSACCCVQHSCFAMTHTHVCNKAIEWSNSPVCHMTLKKQLILLFSCINASEQFLTVVTMLQNECPLSVLSLYVVPPVPWVPDGTTLILKTMPVMAAPLHHSKQVSWIQKDELTAVCHGYPYHPSLQSMHASLTLLIWFETVLNLSLYCMC